jgi:hypothetical protein
MVFNDRLFEGKIGLESGSAFKKETMNVIVIETESVVFKELLLDYFILNALTDDEGRNKPLNNFSVLIFA